MPAIASALDAVLEQQRESGRPLAVVLAGHNGSGKSTFWYRRLAPKLRIPLVNADRMMLSILPDVVAGAKLPKWATELRDTNPSWMQVAQNGVLAFVTHAMAKKVPFAMETVFSYWIENPDGTVESKIGLIQEMQDAGYFVLLVFVGLMSPSLSVARVQTRIAQGGHSVPVTKLHSRFPKTQRAIGVAAPIADATIMVDNSRTLKQAFTVCRIQLQGDVQYDRRRLRGKTPLEIARWMDVVCPLGI